MTTDKITKIVIDSIKLVQKMSGDEYIELSTETIPRDNLNNFDSLREVETTIIIQESLNKLLDKEISLDNNIFFAKNKNGAATIEEIIKNIDNEIS
jgi:hypothetical protein